jgi:hypothetical protein
MDPGMNGGDSGKPEKAPYAPPYFRRLDVEESEKELILNYEVQVHDEGSIIGTAGPPS